jgi:hypothetical protein
LSSLFQLLMEGFAAGAGLQPWAFPVEPHSNDASISRPEKVFSPGDGLRSARSLDF